MTLLHPGERTEALTSSLQMKNIMNAEYAAIDDIGVTMSGYGIDTNVNSVAPAEVWAECEAMEEYR